MAKQITIRGLILKHIPRMFKRGQLHTEAQETVLPAQKLPRQFWSSRSLWIRHLDCGSCNGCELELTVLENPVYDAQHLGIEFKSSPRHADVIAMTGPFTRNLAEAAKLTIGAMPVQRIVLIGDCAIDKGIYQGSYALGERSTEMENAIIAKVPGCPPTPQQILDVLIKPDLLRPSKRSPVTGQSNELPRDSEN
jgi:Ni,Fe-hydrogenase III small subunit